MAWDPAVTALNAFSTGVHGSAYNLANVSTDGFNPVAVAYRSGTPDDRGVHAVVSRPGTDSVSLSEAGRAAAHGVQPSGTDTARELTSMMQDQRAFEANAATVRTADEMSRTTLDLIV